MDPQKGSSKSSLKKDPQNRSPRRILRKDPQKGSSKRILKKDHQTGSSKRILKRTLAGNPSSQNDLKLLTPSAASWIYDFSLRVKIKTFILCKYPSTVDPPAPPPTDFIRSNPYVKPKHMKGNVQETLPKRVSEHNFIEPALQKMSETSERSTEDDLKSQHKRRLHTVARPYIRFPFQRKRWIVWKFSASRMEEHRAFDLRSSHFRYLIFFFTFLNSNEYTSRGASKELWFVSEILPLSKILSSRSLRPFAELRTLLSWPEKKRILWIVSNQHLRKKNSQKAGEKERRSRSLL